MFVPTALVRPFSVLLLLACLCAAWPTLAAEDAPEAVTTQDPEIVIEELKLLLKPLPKQQLLAEASAWQNLLQQKAEEIAAVEVKIRRDNQEMRAAKEAEELATEAQVKLEEAKEKTATAARESSEEAAKSAEEAVDEAREHIAKLQDAAPEAAKEQAGAIAGESGQGSRLERAADAAADHADAKEAQKLTLLEQATELREERTGLVDRLHAVLDELERKTDAADSETLATIQDYRLYTSAVSGITVDVQDTRSAWVAIKGWLLSEEGGKRWAMNLLRFAVILVIAVIISGFVSAAIRHGLKRVQGTSMLLEEFLVRGARWIVIAIGLIMALAALEVSVGPLLAIVGAAGFVLAFALQDSLGNFASGLMILFFRPFDQGDAIEAGGVSGKVQSMNLVSTTILTFDNKRMVVPNNKIWNDVITNITGVTERRVDLEFGIGYADDEDLAAEILTEIVNEHPKVLKDPEPVIRLHALADSSVNFIVRPWAKSEDYWDVYWDITRTVKERFDAKGIGIPFPQRDVHLFVSGEANDALKQLSGTSVSAPTGRSSQMKDGGLDEG